MEKKSNFNRSDSPLQLFEELFEPLLSLSREINVRYHAFNEKSGNKEAWRIVISPGYWLPHVEYIRDKLYQLTSIVDDERFIFPNDESGITRQHQFKSFANCTFFGPMDGDIHLFTQGIRLKIVMFAEVWLEVILDAIGRVDLMYKLLLQSLAVDGVMPSHSSDNAER